MLKVWIDNTYQTKGNLVNYVRSLLSENGLDGYTNIEVPSFSRFSDSDLGSDFEIVDYGSRDTILICVDGVVHTDEAYINEWIRENND